MPVTLSCTGCLAMLRVRDELAGKKVKCPKCAKVLVVPAPQDDATEIMPADGAVTAEPRGKPRQAIQREEDYEDRPRKGRARRDEDEEDDDRTRRVRDEDEDERPRGKSRGRRDEEEEEEERPRKKKKARHEEDEDEEVDRKGAKKYKSCPRCGASGAKRVAWTPWGSFYGPAMFTHVKCPDCGYAYNGKTGGSNLLPAIIFVTVPLMGIIAIIAFIVYIFYVQGYFGAR